MHKDGLLEFKPKNEIFSGRISSIAWNQFHVILDANNNQTIDDYVVCIKCCDFVEYNGSTTSNLINHKCNTNRFKSINYQSEERARQFNPNHIQKIRDALVKFVTLDIRPFYAIEGEGLMDLLIVMAEFGNMYSSLTQAELRKLIPSRRTIKRDTEAVAEEMKNEIALRFREALDYPGGFSCTIDIWTENHTHISYLGITAHLSVIKNKKISRSQYVFHVDAINESHLTGDNIYTNVEKVFREYGVKKEEIESKITFISDRGKNIVAALSTCPRINCYAHLLNNLVHSMCETKAAETIITNCSSLVRYINKSSLKNDRKLTKSLKQYCETRWNTCQVMIESVYENYDSTYNVLCEKERESSTSTHLTQKITCLQKDELAAMNEFLKPFTNMTKRIEGDLKPTIHMIWPIYRKIYAYLQPNAGDITLIAEMRSEGLKYLLKSHDAFEPTMQHKVAVFLHPMLKKMSFASSLIVNEIHNFVQETLGAPDVNVNNDPAANDAVNVPNNNDSIFDEFLNDIDMQVAPTRCNELERYIEFTIEPVSCKLNRNRAQPRQLNSHHFLIN